VQVESSLCSLFLFRLKVIKGFAKKLSSWWDLFDDEILVVSQLQSVEVSIVAIEKLDGFAILPFGCW